MKITFLIGHMVKERDLILYELAEDLGKHGAQVTIISGYPSRRISDDVRQYYISHPVERIGESVTSIRVGSKSGEGKGLFERMIKYLFLSKAIVEKAITLDTDVFYIYSTPPFLGYYAGRLKKIAPVVYNAQDLFPDSLKTAKHFSESNILIKLLRRFEKSVYNNSDKIITISEDMKKHIISNGADGNKILVVNNWADTNAIEPIHKDDNGLFEEFGIDKNKFTVLYAGDIGLHQRLDIFFDAACYLNGVNDDIQFVFFGNGVYEPVLKRKIQERNLKNFYVLPLQPVERISEVYSMGDIDIVSLEKGMTRLALPSKIWSVMSAGRPILALLDSDSDVARMVNDGLGLVVDGMNCEEIAKLLIELEKDNTGLAKMGEKARCFVRNNNNRFVQTHKYYEILRDCADRTGNMC